MPFMFILGIIFLVFVLPLWLILDFIGKLRKNRNFSGEEEKMLEDLWRLSQKMENRINNLEIILERDEREERYHGHQSNQSRSRRESTHETQTL